MSSLTEGELEFVFEGAVSARKFDGDDHGLTHCMKAVDFIIEFVNRYLFVEVKDPQDSRATEQNRREWIEKFTSGRLDHSLKYKYRDSFLYEWAAGRGDKPIVYVVLIALDSLDGALMLSRQDQLREQASAGLQGQTQSASSRGGAIALRRWGGDQPGKRQAWMQAEGHFTL